MAYDEYLDERVGDIVSEWGASRKKMFGGTAYMLNGNLLGGVHGDRLILRLSPDAGGEALQDARVAPFDMVPRPMPGWVMVEQAALEGDSLRQWLERARTFVLSLPPK